MGEDEHLGNVTPRLLTIRDGLNTAIIRRGYTGGNIVHHSDEGGRPFVNDIDLAVFAVVPGQAAPYCITSVPDLREFVSGVVERGSAPVFSPGWMKQLVFSAQYRDPKTGKTVNTTGADLRKELLDKTAARKAMFDKAAAARG